VAAIGLSVLSAHWLFGAAPGVNLVLCFGAVGGATIAFSGGRASPRRLVGALALLALALLPVLVAGALLSFTATFIIAALSALLAAGRLPSTIGGGAFAFANFTVTGPFRALFRLARARISSPRPLTGGRLKRWRVAACLGVVFVLLLREANPVIEDWLAVLSLERLFNALDDDVICRALLAIFLFPPILSALAPPAPLNRAKTGDADGADPNVAPKAATGDLIDPQSTFNAILLFNGIFAVHTGLDLWLLWGGGALPEGVTYADYAHRGAYPLIATALLSAAFVVFALPPGSAAERDGATRRLVYLWLAQNGLLVASSILRLDLYIDVYGLTILRAAALIWMALVATGLGLIVARLALQRSNAWLIAVNAAAAAATLYACCFVNFTALTAAHNVVAARASDGPPLDIAYLRRLGPHALPAIDVALADWGGERRSDSAAMHDLSRWRDYEAAAYRARMRDWRSWTFRSAALFSYLDANAAAPHNPVEVAP
ncbi:MAG: DUF4173 domain-containing protein, partial [Pseudomonadota bacterium]